MSTLVNTTIRNKSLLQMALDKLDQAGAAWDRAYKNYLESPTPPHEAALMAASQAYKQVQRTYQAAQLVYKHNHLAGRSH